MTTEQKAQELAEKIAAFIKHNNIDITAVSMDIIVAGYFAAKEKTDQMILEYALEVGPDTFLQ